MSFILFILVNATLFLRPGEVVPELLGISIYEYLIIACLIFALPEVMHYLFTARDSQPVTFCVVGLLVTIVLSHLATLKMEEAGRAGIIFLKVVVYYLLLVSVVNTPARLRQFLFWIACFVVVMAVVTVLQYHEVIQLPTLRILSDIDTDPLTGQQISLRRLQGSGIFNDPNEFCLMLGAAMPLALYQLTNRRASFLRFLWVAPLGLFFYGVSLTHSRGGFLAMLAGLGTLALVRLGWRRFLLIAPLGLPVLFVFFAGRQTDLSPTSGTGQSRVQIWSDWFADFKQAPVFGVGMVVPDEAKDIPAATEAKYVAHNSYLHAFTELGFFGGMFFLGLACLMFYGVWRLATCNNLFLDPEQRRLAPYLLGVVACYFVGMLSLSLSYVTSTYVIFGIAAAYMRVTVVYPPLPSLRFDFPMARRLAFASVLFLAGLVVFIRIFVRWT
jgi:hypothetical protein